MTQITWLDPILYKNRLVHTLRKLQKKTPSMSILDFASRAIKERIAKEDNGKEDPNIPPRRKDFLDRFLEIHSQNSKLPPWYDPSPPIILGHGKSIS